MAPTRAGTACTLALTLLLALAGAALAACPAADGEAGGPGAPGPGPGPGGSGGSGQDECPDLSSSGSCLHEDGLPGCGRDTACTVASLSCPGGTRCCTLPFQCAPRAGDLPGAARCESDGECRSGLCLEIRDGVRLCLRACNDPEADSCPAGLHCTLVPLAGGASVRSCVGGEAGAEDFDATICRSDRDCVEGRICRILHGELLQSYGAIPLCLPPTGAAPDLGRRCDLANPDVRGGWDDPETNSAACVERGLCGTICDSSDAASCNCPLEEYRAGSCTAHVCSLPCTRDTDCPQRQLCTGVQWGPPDRPEADYELRSCQAPGGHPTNWYCRDDLDCCRDGVQRDGEPCCETSQGRCRDPNPAQERTTCSVVNGGSKLLTLCEVPLAPLRDLGEPCTAAADCASSLCLEGGAGPICSSPCLAAENHCERLLPGTSCCPTVHALGCVEACRADCEPAAACTL